MAKIQRRGKAGNAAKYITRTQAVKKLQLRLSEFRRLCILKGVHPREPKKKVKGQNKTYYHVKDINFLAHEPLLDKFREIQAHERKVRRARARRNGDLARALRRRAPSYRLDHLVRERYPSFADALRDSDDALSLVHLFATLPASSTAAIPAAVVATSRRLVLEWQAFLVRARALRRAFVAVKGIYLQAEVQGQTITWLMPHATGQVLPQDIDYRVMLTFLEFYHTLLKFVFFKLYHDLGLKYPPAVDPAAEQAAAELAAIIAELSGAASGAAAEGVAGEEASRTAGNAALSDGEMQARAATLPPGLRAAARSAGAEEAGGAGIAVEAYGGAGGANGGRGATGGEPSSSAETSTEVDSEAEGAGAEDEEADASGGGAAMGAVDAVGAEGAEEEEEEEGDSEDGDLEIDSGSGAESGGEEDGGGIGSEIESEASEGDAVAVQGPTPGGTGAADGAAGGGSHSAPDGALAARQASGLEAEPRGAGAPAATTDAELCATLFDGLVVFLSRESPREVLMLIVRAFGGTACWSGPGSPLPEASDLITHAVVDRPGQGHRHLSREYVQPQWVFDCANFRVLIGTAAYAPGQRPPPHLSPFLDYRKEAYVPDYARELLQLQAAAGAVRQRASGGAIAMLEAPVPEAGGAGASGEEGDAAEDVEAEFQRELVEELGGAMVPQQPKRRRQEGDEDAISDAQKVALLTRKQRKLYQGMRKREEAEKERVASLDAKRKAAKEAKRHAPLS